MIEKTIKVFLNAIPVIVMIGLIPIISDDYLLSIIYLCIIAFSFVIKRDNKDYLFLAFGFFIMIFAEFIFVSTGVETFVRHSLFGLMPLWLPILWSYAFVAMKRSIIIIGK